MARMRPEREVAWIVVVEASFPPRGIYCGQSLGLAAIRLEPGTIYGCGQTRIEAQQNAFAWAVKFAHGRGFKPPEPTPDPLSAPSSPPPAASPPAHLALPRPLTSPVSRHGKANLTDPPLAYRPTREEIAAACLRFQEGWSEQETRARSLGIRSQTAWREEQQRAWLRMLGSFPATQGQHSLDE